MHLCRLDLLEVPAPGSISKQDRYRETQRKAWKGERGNTHTRARAHTPPPPHTHTLTHRERERERERENRLRQTDRQTDRQAGRQAGRDSELYT
eukprot:COSAG03_NODE_3424_length_2024_cov_7.637591_2_plen_94_part_00